MDENLGGVAPRRMQTAALYAVKQGPFRAAPTAQVLLLQSEIGNWPHSTRMHIAT